MEEVRVQARDIGRSVVGLFRSHRRPGALRPSLADRGLISTLFTEPVCVLLLVEAGEPNSAAFFIAQNRQIPAEPSVREFKFDEREFRMLPEVEPETPRPRQPEPRRQPKPDTYFLPCLDWIGWTGGGLFVLCPLAGSGNGKRNPALEIQSDGTSGVQRGARFACGVEQLVPCFR